MTFGVEKQGVVQYFCGVLTEAFHRFSLSTQEIMSTCAEKKEHNMWNSFVPNFFQSPKEYMPGSDLDLMWFLLIEKKVIKLS